MGDGAVIIGLTLEQRYQSPVRWKRHHCCYPDRDDKNNNILKTGRMSEHDNVIIMYYTVDTYVWCIQYHS